MVEPGTNSATNKSCMPLSFKPAATPETRTPEMLGIFGSGGNSSFENMVDLRFYNLN
ncbi:MAG: hypothetical protein ACKVKC_08705 [Rhodobacterales bacterium]